MKKSDTCKQEKQDGAMLRPSRGAGHHDGSSTGMATDHRMLEKATEKSFNSPREEEVEEKEEGNSLVSD